MSTEAASPIRLTGAATQARSVFFDWSGGPVHALHDDDENVVVYAGLDHLLNSLTGPTMIRGEATFESFNVQRREEIIRRCEKEGHDFKVINPRATSKRRVALGYKKKTDEIDVRVIRNLALDGKTHFTPVVLPQPELQDKRNAANAKLMLLRRTRVPRVSTRAKHGFVFDGEKDKYATDLIKLLPSVDDLTDEQNVALCSGTKKRTYSKCVVAAVGVIAEVASNSKEFDHISGLYQNGYPSQIRSDLMMHRWARVVSGKLRFSAYRRVLRWLFHTIKDAMIGSAAKSARPTGAARRTRDPRDPCAARKSRPSGAACATRHGSQNFKEATVAD